MITASAKAVGDELGTSLKLRLGLPNVLNKVSLTFFVLSVSVALQAPPAVKMQQQENQQLELEESVSTAAIMSIEVQEQQGAR